MPQDRVFGAVNGYGTQVRVKSGPTQLEDSGLGHAILPGIFRSGPLNEVVSLEGGSDQYLQVYGVGGARAQTAIQAMDFYTKARGSGVLHVLRLGSAGTGARAAVRVRARDGSRSILHQLPMPAPSVWGMLDAHNVGRWGGRQRTKSVSTATLTWAAATTVEGLVAASDPAERWEDADVIVKATDGETWRARVARVDNETKAAELDSPAPAWVQADTTGVAVLLLTNEDRDLEQPEQLEVRITDDPQAPGALFALQYARDGVPIGPALSGLTMRADTRDYWPDRLAAASDLRMTYGPGDDLFSGDRNSQEAMPAAWCGIARDLSSDGMRAYFQITNWTRSAQGAGDAYLDAGADFQDPQLWTGELVIVCTFTDPTTFSWEAYPAGVDLATVDALDLVASGTGETLGSAVNDDGSGGALSPILPRFTLRAGASAMQAGDTITIVHRPLPPNLAQRGAVLRAALPDEGNTALGWAVVGNTRDSVTVGVDLAAENLDVAGFPTVLGTELEPYDLTGGGQTLILTVGGEQITLTNTLTSATATLAQVVAELEALELARAGSEDAKLVTFSADTSKLRITALRDQGPEALITIGNGTINAILGFTNGQEAAGAEPQRLHVEFPLILEGGEDPAMPGEAETVAMLDPGSSPLNNLLDKPTGTMAVAMPDFDDGAPPTILRAAVTWCYTHNAVLYHGLPRNLTREGEAVAYDNLVMGGLGDQLRHRRLFWPAHGRRNTLPGLNGERPMETSMLGAILGLRARKAADAGGYHVPAAGTEAQLQDVFTALPTWAERRLDVELLGKAAINVVKRYGAAIIVWGNRMTAPGVVQASRVETDVHVQRTLLTQTDRLAFQLINDAGLSNAAIATRDLFRRWYVAGWFDDTDGPALEDQVEIVAARSNNPLVTRQVGETHVMCNYRVVFANERTVFTVGPKGLSVQS